MCLLLRETVSCGTYQFCWSRNLEYVYVYVFYLSELRFCTSIPCCGPSSASSASEAVDCHRACLWLTQQDIGKDGLMMIRLEARRIDISIGCICRGRMIY